MSIPSFYYHDLNPVTVKNLLKVDKEELPKYFSSGNKKSLGAIRERLLVKIHRLKHLIKTGVRINDQKILKVRKLSSSIISVESPPPFPDLHQFISHPTTPPPSPLIKNDEKFAPLEPIRIPSGTFWTPEQIKVFKLGLDSLSVNELQIAFIHAVGEGCLEVLEHFANHEFDFNFANDAHEIPPLNLAILTNHPKTALYLLDQGVSPHPQQDFSPLFDAVNSNYPEVISMLIEKGASLSEINASGESLLERALYHRSHEALEELLAHDANPNENAILYQAIKYEDLTAVQLLLRYGADPNILANDIPIFAATLSLDNPAFFRSMFSFLDPEMPSEAFANLLLRYASPAVLELILQNKIDPTPFELDGIYNQFYLANQAFSTSKGEHLNVFHRYGVDVEEHRDWLRQTFLTHRFGINFSSLSKSSSFFTIPEIEKSLRTFFQAFPLSAFPEFTEQARTKILTAFNEKLDINFSSNEVIQHRLHHYEEGQIILIPTGWKAHTTYRFVYKGIIAESNRGEEIDSSIAPGLQLKTFSGSPQNVLGITPVMSRQEALQLQNRLYEELNTQEFLSFKYRPQKAGTCTWAGLKTAFRGMLFVLIAEKLQESLPHDQVTLKAEAIADSIYKKWSSWDREHILQEALTYYRTPGTIKPNKVLLKAIDKKFKGPKSTKHLLKKVIHQK
ncbi:MULTISPECIES: ankyrin repeat domain-containing protein [Parachlamydia]|uniref:ankyrin repeat domain-containing protein n=1 Tax=Parachlamydia TaxID=83551 RepID=UPI0001C17C9E|nr:ankyrin repeat domain-containing protein [Parachlamydia acanthamoebae]EFB42179.1 hypothetical protein pah_c014o111 [Parachlamydia acanthamoebae str. Hall's coccus]